MLVIEMDVRLPAVALHVVPVDEAREAETVHDLLLLMEWTGGEEVDRDVLALLGEEVDEVEDREVRPAPIWVSSVRSRRFHTEANRACAPRRLPRTSFPITAD